MPLTAEGLKNAILTELGAVAPVAPGDPSAQQWRDDFAGAVANAVINYLLANNVVQHPMGPGKVT